MKLNLKVSKLANNFFFISNLSEWHFSCRKKYNDAWLKQTGNLSDLENKTISDFRDIILKHGFEMEKSFYSFPEKEVWNKLEKKLRKSELRRLKKTFDIFNPRFEKIWEKDAVENKMKAFQKSLNDERYCLLVENLNVFLKNRDKKKNFTVIILDSPLNEENVTAAGGANMDDLMISLELPVLKPKSWELEYSIGILLHEIAHLLLKESDYFPYFKSVVNAKLPGLVNRNIRPRITNLEFISELIIELLIPFGYLAQKHFIFKPLKTSFSKKNLNVLRENFKKFRQGKEASGSRLRKTLVWRLYPVVKKYIEDKKGIDESFVQKVIKTILIEKIN
ncbi:MAG: hypothetical protein PHZ25_03490 [Candidatus Pacebacteria bacterium]|nr:hypothetical protein [Candidatus Paceibacterota bacterium]